MSNLNFIIPELFLTFSILVLLITGVYRKNSFNLIYRLSAIILLATIILTINNVTENESVYLFNNTFKIDYLSSFMKVLTLASCIFVLFSSFDYIKTIGINKIEYPILILSSTLGMMIMISSFDLILFYMGLEG